MSAAQKQYQNCPVFGDFGELQTDTSTPQGGSIALQAVPGNASPVSGFDQ
jgi:hypothetical protein